jgi:rubrerythrin
MASEPLDGGHSAHDPCWGKRPPGAGASAPYNHVLALPRGEHLGGTLMTPNSFQELVDFAIEQEQEAADFYTELANTVKEQHVCETLRDFANQERGHMQKLQSVRASGKASPSSKSPLDLKISDYLVETKPTPQLTFQGALIIAMSREKASFRLYRDLASQCEEEPLREVFLFLAQEEANHKLAFEIEYDDLILQEN